MQLSDIRVMYPAFESIFETHVRDAKFDALPMKAQAFRAHKLAIISLFHILDKYKHLGRDAQSALFQALVVERNYQKALNLLPRRSNRITRWVSSLWSDDREDEAFKYDMKRKAAQIPDSQFLRDLENTNDENLQSAAQRAKTLAQRELSFSINEVVRTMTYDVLAMQKDLCGRQALLQVDNEEREILNTALVQFIREINKKSAKGQRS